VLDGDARIALNTFFIVYSRFSIGGAGIDVVWPQFRALSFVSDLSFSSQFGASGLPPRTRRRADSRDAQPNIGPAIRHEGSCGHSLLKRNNGHGSGSHYVEPRRATHFTNACLLMQIKASIPSSHNLTLGIRLGQPNIGMN
jgi:hypothetical protein